LKNRKVFPFVGLIDEVAKSRNFLFFVIPVKIGDYRLGLKLSGNTLELIRFLHRKDIYRRFP